MSFKEKEAAVKLLGIFGFDPKIAELIGEECNLTVAVFAKNGKECIEKNKQLMAASAELGLGYRAVSGDGLFVYLKTKTAAGGKSPAEQIAQLKAERDELYGRLAALEARSAVTPSRQADRGDNTGRRPPPPPLDEDAHFGD